jgi:signal transduction histidine kinase
MAQQTIDTDRIAPSSSTPVNSAREQELELLVLHLNEEVARLKKERIESELMSRRLVGELEPQVRESLSRRLSERHVLPQSLQNGAMLPPSEIPPEAVLDVAELIYWRHALAEATQLQTFFFLRDGDSLVPAANNPSQLPVLAKCHPACLKGVDEIVRDRGPRPHSLHVRCPGCQGAVWVVPLVLNYRGDEAVLGCLVGHDVPEPAEPFRRMVSLVSNLVSQRASEEYADQATTVLDMEVTALIKRFTEDQSTLVRDARIGMLEYERTTQDLALTQENLEKALVEAGKARREAERSNRVKSLFLAAMSHEIRTPLTCVIGFADLLTLPSLKEAEIRQFAASIKESGHILMSLINNVLDLSKIEAGRLELEYIPFDIHGILKEIHAIFLSSASEKGLELILEMGEDVPAELTGDPTRIRQVVMNLVSNAIKFTSEGSIVVSCCRSKDTPDFLALTVADTGQGIAPDMLPRVFDAFRQADAGIGRQYGGTGLGLAISLRIMQEMGGSLSAESEVGEGSTFSCRLPIYLNGVDPDLSSDPGTD